MMGLTQYKELSTGGYIVLGYTSSFGGEDIWILKLHSDGSIVWQNVME